MGLYSRWVVPHLIDLAMRNPVLDRYRQHVTGKAWGLVLEIGVGSGLNLPLYGSAVDGVCAIDPSLELLHRARRRIADATVPIWMLGTSAKYLPFVDAIFDTVVTTLDVVLDPRSACGAD